jgi:hypothetical protein
MGMPAIASFKEFLHSRSCVQAKKDKSDELRLTPLSLSWYHSDVVTIMDPLMDGRVSADVVCANLRSLQLRKYATALDTASGIAVNVLNRADGSTDAKAALASVTQSAQKIQDVLNQFVADDASFCFSIHFRSRWCVDLTIVMSIFSIQSWRS